ncbi:MAG TPA: hypothetical protein VHR66_33015 [Gemmataceae bacterium]|jgi:hypothetical protein|nr:hypothetical protein [Gemmataceae bacterium]
MKTFFTVALVLAAQVIVVGSVCLVIVLPFAFSFVIGPVMTFGVAKALGTIGEVWKPEVL